MCKVSLPAMCKSLNFLFFFFFFFFLFHIKIKGALRAISLIRNNVKLILVFLDVLYLARR